MKGIASVLLDDCFAVHDIRIIEGDNGLFIAMRYLLIGNGKNDILRIVFISVYIHVCIYITLYYFEYKLNC